MAEKEIEKLQQAIAPLKQQITEHKVYSAISSIEELGIFMQYHSYAVWDFMSLLKSLQIGLTCTQVPWFPVGSANVRSLINEIVAGEESDIDLEGNKKSHFEMYIDAMEQCGASTQGIHQFITELKNTGNFISAFESAQTPDQARKFVDFTFSIIGSGKAHLQASAFTFGREDLIPSMFYALVTDLNDKFPNKLSMFKYYLDRHIEVDGDHHSHLALEMVSSLCKQEPELWESAKTAAIESLQQRIHLWDAAYQAIATKKNKNL